MKCGISVILCSHNPRADYLERTLESLKGQSVPYVEWEFLLIDNASEEPISDKIDLSWHPNSRIVREDRLGLTSARLRGISESEGSLIVFVDDDNVLDADYLETALKMEKAFPFLGSFGAGVLEPEFEIEPPSELVPLTGLLALRKVDQILWTNNFEDTACIPWGAGLCVRRVVAEGYTDLLSRLAAADFIGRKGEDLSCGEDDLFSWVSLTQGLGYGIFPDLRIKHLISRGRLSREYFLKLLNGHAFSHGVLRYLLFGTMPERRNWKNLIRCIVCRLRAGRFAMQTRWATVAGGERAWAVVRDRGMEPIEFELSSD